jgi:hypothetical protein
MKNLLSQIPLYDPDKGKLEGVGPLGLEGVDPSQAPLTFNTFLSGIIGLMTIVASIWFVFLFLAGAIGIMTSGADKAARESAQKRITNGLIGIIVVVAAIFLIRLIGNILGLELILNPAMFLSRIAGI